MKKLLLFLFFVFAFLPVKVFAQADTMGNCNCYTIADSAKYKPVPLTLGKDSTGPPYYYNNVNTTLALKLPFKFCFYGTSYDSVYIGNKGNITFIKPIPDFTTGNLPAGKDTAMIAPLWTNISNIPYGPHPAGVGEIWYQMYPSHMVVIWSQVGCYKFDNDLYDDFQMTISDGSDSIIPGGNNVQFCYQLMQWASGDSSGGSNGFNGVPATIGINKGDNTSYAVISRFHLPGATFYGPDSTKNGLYWLNNKSLILNTCVTEKNIAPVIINTGFCDTISICKWDSLQYSLHFLCAEQGQKATLTATAPTIAGLKFDTVHGNNNIYGINIRAGIGAAAPGYHTITITATDNSVPPQTATYPIVVNVAVCTGINEVSSSDSKFTVYPNVTHGKFTIDLDNGLLPENCEVKIYDVPGNQIYSAKLHDAKNETDLSSKPRGMYFVKTYSGPTLLGIKKIVLQ
jgi:hypothetical protein